MSAWERKDTLALFVLTLTLLSLVPWREDVYFTGGLDPVVLAKAAVSVMALALALAVWGTEALGRLAPWTVVAVVVYVTASVLGAVTGGQLLASGALAARMLLVLGTVSLVVAGTPPARLPLISALSAGWLGTVLGLSGIPVLLSGTQTGTNAGRLAGALLPVGPNLLAMLLTVPVLVLIWHVTSQPLRLWQLCLLIPLLGLTWLTGSRSGLLALAAAALIVVVRSPRLSFVGFAGLLATLPAGVALATLSPVVTEFLGRGGEASLLTLNSRTIAWTAAFDRPVDAWARWLGQGLSEKTVPVTEGFVEDQVLDSSWVSAYVQAGWLGLTVMAIWILAVVVRWWRSPMSEATLWLALSVYVLARSIVENGLIDAYLLFPLTLLPALAVDLPSRTGRAEEASRPERHDAREEPRMSSPTDPVSTAAVETKRVSSSS